MKQDFKTQSKMSDTKTYDIKSLKDAETQRQTLDTNNKKKEDKFEKESRKCKQWNSKMSEPHILARCQSRTYQQDVRASHISKGLTNSGEQDSEQGNT